MITFVPSAAQDEGFKIPEKYTQKRKGKQPAKPFALKLMEILSRREYEHIITWLPDGRSFKIIRPKEFTENIMPIHLKRAKWSTFQRKMACWGFQKLNEEAEAGAKCFGFPTTFFHPHFQRNRTDLIEKIKFSKSKQAPSPTLRSIAPGSSMGMSSPLISHSSSSVGMPSTPITISPDLTPRAQSSKSLPPKKRFTRAQPPQLSLESGDSVLEMKKNTKIPHFTLPCKSSFVQTSLQSLLLQRYQREKLQQERDQYERDYKRLLIQKRLEDLKYELLLVEKGCKKTEYH